MPSPRRTRPRFAKRPPGRRRHRGVLFATMGAGPAVILLLAAPGVGAQTGGSGQASVSPAAVSAPASPAQTADPKRGGVIATTSQGCSEAVGCFPCFQCHGAAGAGKVGADFPRLTRQSYAYLYESLRNFASGLRPNPTMHQVASSLTDQAMRDVAAYYASVEPQTHEQAAAAEALAHPDFEELQKGAVLAAVGDASRGIQACGNCHGPQGAGLPPTYPYLAGQYADYLEAQLKAWKNGGRHGDPLDIMGRIAMQLSDDEVHQVSQYYASIRPSQPTAQTDASGAFMPPPDHAEKESGAADGARAGKPADATSEIGGAVRP